MAGEEAPLLHLRQASGEGTLTIASPGLVRSTFGLGVGFGLPNQPYPCPYPYPYPYPNPYPHLYP